MRRTLAITVSLGLFACSTPSVDIKQVCLPMKTYTLAQGQAAAKELAAMPANSEIAAMITDYGAMRAANRACIAP